MTTDTLADLKVLAAQVQERREDAAFRAQVCCSIKYARERAGARARAPAYKTVIKAHTIVGLNTNDIVC